MLETRSTDLVQFQAERGSKSFAVLMIRSSALVQRAELEAEGWAVEIVESRRPLNLST